MLVGSVSVCMFACFCDFGFRFSRLGLLVAGCLVLLATCGCCLLVRLLLVWLCGYCFAVIFLVVLFVVIVSLFV